MSYLSGIVLLISPLVVTASPCDPSGTKGEPSVEAILARFAEGDPGWKVRMESLVWLAKSGSSVVPGLVAALESKVPAVREFAAQALVLFPDPAARSALNKVLDDPKAATRIYAIHALSTIGPLPLTDRYSHILKTDPSTYGVRTALAAALERTDQPNPVEFRKALADYDLARMDTAKLGQLAPDFHLTDFDGKTHQLSQARGKTVVLRFILFDF